MYHRRISGPGVNLVKSRDTRSLINSERSDKNGSNSNNRVSYNPENVFVITLDKSQGGFAVSDFINVPVKIHRTTDPCSI
ncbi:unnamed protein product [Acanthoscelides obtectus]|uniref:Uncharacterized protein n=1 Tax=Acanthoscelides obtectus TaxID=200917 RepID=A0A9P0KFC4_ACAOB|nr:unnamed protein product [Acanthoscelides obtectus]CAK1624755.1 hypothetical protein AOBTE_LOCUS2742 [Acanthoscelides obtectus]